MAAAGAEEETAAHRQAAEAARRTELPATPTTTTARMQSLAKSTGCPIGTAIHAAATAAAASAAAAAASSPKTLASVEHTPCRLWPLFVAASTGLPTDRRHREGVQVASGLIRARGQRQRLVRLHGRWLPHCSSRHAGALPKTCCGLSREVSASTTAPVNAAVAPRAVAGTSLPTQEAPRCCWLRIASDKSLLQGYMCNDSTATAAAAAAAFCCSCVVVAAVVIVGARAHWPQR